MIVALLLVALIIFLNIYNLRRRNRGKLPKTYQPTTRAEASSFPEDLTRDRYLLKKVPEHVDYIVIGSGISGLASAAILSKLGKKVLVIEQHYVAGGNLHAFTDKGYEFETGLHYINAESRKSMGMGRLLNLLVEEPIEWCNLGREDPKKMIYDKVFVGEDSFEFRSGVNNLKEDLKKKFPGEEKAIDDYFVELKKCAKLSGLAIVLKIITNNFIYNFLYKVLNRFWAKYYKTTAHEMVAKFTKNRKLEAILCTQFGDYGLPPHVAPSSMHALVSQYYTEGAHFPKGGPQEIARSLIETIYLNHGKVLVSKRVKKIIIDEDKNSVIGVEMETGDTIGCSKVISAVGYSNTFEKLLPEKYIKTPVYKSMKACLQQTSHCMILFIGLKGSPSELKLPSHNLWVYPNEFYEDWFPKYNENPLDNEGFYFIGFGSSKDAAWEAKHPDKSTGVIITFCRRDIFEKWESKEVKHRGNDYKELKEKFTNKLLEQFYKYYPHLKEHVDYLDLGTPLSCEHFLGAYKGAIYGYDHQKERFLDYHRELRPKTSINGLYLTGQDIVSAGITPSFMSGFVTVSHILNYSLFDMVAGRNLISELHNLKKAEKKTI